MSITAKSAKLCADVRTCLREHLDLQRVPNEARRGGAVLLLGGNPLRHTLLAVAVERERALQTQHTLPVAARPRVVGQVVGRHFQGGLLEQGQAVAGGQHVAQGQPGGGDAARLAVGAGLEIEPMLLNEELEGFGGFVDTRTEDCRCKDHNGY